MAEIRNTFVKSKMNKDLDDRLLSKGEYRNAENIQVSKSEDSDVGALENVLGNGFINLSAWPVNVPNLEVIGHLVDNSNDRAFFIATNYTDTSSDELSNPAPYGAACYILMFDNKATGSAKGKILVEGRFLNFSKTNPVYGIDLIEDLLFWTDNRNQPRKINITKAIANNSFYTTEDQISVAKYMPVNPPRLFEDVTITEVATFGSGEGYSHQSTSTEGVTKLRAGMELVVVPEPTVGTPGMPIYVSSVDYSNNKFRTIIPIDLGNLDNGRGSNTCVFRERTYHNVVDEYLPPSFYAVVDSATDLTTGNYNVVVSASAGDSGITQPIPVSGSGSGTTSNSIMKVTGAAIDENINITTNNGLSYNTSSTKYRIIINEVTGKTASDLFTAGDVLFFSQPNPHYNANWPGDKAYLEDKFVRFAYRFKFVDGEYSLISPFTQSVFLPKQEGYFMSGEKKGGELTNTRKKIDTYKQENSTASSTIVDFFENSIQDVKVIVDTPFKVNELASKLLVEEIEIIYKESDGLALKVVETIPVTNSTVTGNSTNVFEFLYQSKEPIKTLDPDEIVRVFDKTPIRALTQSVTGNRVVYGNFTDKHTPPENLKYSVGIDEKYPIKSQSAYRISSGCRNAYPTHSVKQNRTYQVGVVLADRYGRQSDVVLSDVNLDSFKQTNPGLDETYGSSTIFHPYPTSINLTAREESISSGRWRGDSIKLLFRDVIPETVNYADGYPGLYKSGEYTVKVDGDVTTNDEIIVVDLDINIAVGDIVDISGTIVSIKELDASTKKITVSSSISVTNNTVLTIYGPGNKLGWYSYKVVVKQLEQDYYNVYVPTIINHVPGSATPNITGENCYTTIFSDNINKIPSELEEVQPEQTLFSTNKSLMYPLVAQVYNPNCGTGASQTSCDVDYYSNERYYLGQEYITADIIGKLNDVGMAVGGGGVSKGIYKPEQNPQTVVFTSFGNIIGQTASDADQSQDGLFFTNYRLSILETEPVRSRIEIFYETSTSGLISDLNKNITDSNLSLGPLNPSAPPDVIEQ